MTNNFGDFKEYYKKQFEYYDEKACTNKRNDRIFKISQIILSAILPVSITLFPVTSSQFWKYVVIAFSLLLLIIESLKSYLNYQKKWLSYRTTAEALRREKQRFDTKTGKYASASKPEEIFVDEIMEIVEEENRNWEIATRKAQES